MRVTVAVGEDALIYLDYNATTPCDPQVLEAMLPWFGRRYGNPANGLHLPGREAARAVERARAQVAELIGCRSGEILFTGGATESNNLAILGVARALRTGSRRRIVTTAIEHKAVLLPCRQLAAEGFDVVILPVDGEGRLAPEELASAVDDATLLVSIQAANNEIGTLQNVGALAEIARAHGALVHCDAAQAAGKVAIDVDAWGVDLLSLSAHKFYGPKGCGALYVRGGVRLMGLQPVLFGGGQEQGMRPGTLNVPGIVGMGEAARVAGAVLEQERPRVAALRDRFEARLMHGRDTIWINAAQAERLPNTSSVGVRGVDADALLLNLPQLALGTGSACTTGAVEPSHVLQAIGLSREDAWATLRVSLGRYTTVAEVDTAADALIERLAHRGIAGTGKPPAAGAICG